jgi:two-component system, response regulator YesN
MRNQIYIAEDNLALRNLLKSAIPIYFLDYKDKLNLFEDGKSLYDSIVKNNELIKLVLTDNNMPEMSGLEVIQKCHSVYPDIAFIQMSGRNIEKEAINAGAKYFLEKPFKLEELKSKIEQFL